MFGDKTFVGNTLKLAVIGNQRPAWVRFLTNLPNTSVLLAYKGKLADIGHDSDLQFVVKDSYFLAVSYDLISEDGAMYILNALRKYQLAVKEYRARGTLDERLTGVEFGEFKEQGRWAGRWAAKIAHRGKTLEFVVKNNARTDFKAKENYT